MAPTLCSPGSAPWECCLRQGHIEGMASVALVFSQCCRTSICFWGTPWGS